MSSEDTSTEAVERLAALTFNVQTRLKDREQFVMSIPARPDHDMDLILANAAATLRALAAERDALKAAKWDVRHTDTMNDMVMMGLARDSEAERAEKAEADRDRLAAERDALRGALTALRAAITNENGLNGCAILDTVWVSHVETAVDHIDAALAQKEPGA